MIAGISIVMTGLALMDQLLGAHAAALLMFEIAVCGIFGSVTGVLYARRVGHHDSGDPY